VYGVEAGRQTITVLRRRSSVARTRLLARSHEQSARKTSSRAHRNEATDT